MLDIGTFTSAVTVIEMGGETLEQAEYGVAALGWKCVTLVG